MKSKEKSAAHDKAALPGEVGLQLKHAREKLEDLAESYASAKEMQGFFNGFKCAMQI